MLEKIDKNYIKKEGGGQIMTANTKLRTLIFDKLTKMIKKKEGGGQIKSEKIS